MLGPTERNDPALLNELFKLLGWFCINIYKRHRGKQIVIGLRLTKASRVTINKKALDVTTEQKQKIIGLSMCRNRDMKRFPQNVEPERYLKPKLIWRTQIGSANNYLRDCSCVVILLK